MSDDDTLTTETWDRVTDYADELGLEADTLDDQVNGILNALEEIAARNQQLEAAYEDERRRRESLETALVGQRRQPQSDVQHARREQAASTDGETTYTPDDSETDTDQEAATGAPPDHDDEGEGGVTVERDDSPTTSVK